MSDSDSDCSLSSLVMRRVNSGHRTVPENVEFIFKPKFGEKGKRQPFLYTLKQGKELPHETEIEGFKFIFGGDLKPSLLDDGLSLEKKEKFWVIRKSSGSISNQLFDPSLGSQSLTTPSKTWAPGASSSPILSPSLNSSVVQNTSFHSTVLNLSQTVLEEDEDDGNKILSEEDKDKLDTLIEKGGESLAPFKCKLCSFVGVLRACCYKHIQKDHKDWKIETGSGTPSKSVHLNPNWKDDLKKNFLTIIVENCSTVTREAIANDEEIKDRGKMKKVRKEILDHVIDHVVEEHGTISNPSLAVMRDIVTVMGDYYPKMFRDQGNNDLMLGYGLGGRNGVKRLPELLVDKARHILDKKRGADLGPENDHEEIPPKKMGKKPVAYGVDNRKFYSEANDASVVAALANLGDDAGFDGREEVFSKSRPTMQKEFRTSKNQIGRVCKLFFKSPGHLQKQYEWLTGDTVMRDNVEKNLKPQIGYMEKVLLYEKQTLDFKGVIEELNTLVETDYEGNKTVKEINVLRLTGTHLDQDGSVLIRFEAEPPAKTNSPFILAVELASRSFVFELWADKAKLLGNMTLSAAITAFLQLCFVFNLTYPKECQTLADILQRRVAKYGDDTGSRTLVPR